MHIFLFFPLGLTVFLIKHAKILMMVPKLGTHGLLKIKVLWNKDNDVIICVYDNTSNILSPEANNIADVVM